MALEAYREQHKKRLSWMPWLYFRLSSEHQKWAREWQREVQSEFAFLETIRIGENCFVSPEAALFAEPGRDIVIGSECSIAAHAFLHGPIRLGKGVSINARVTLDGGAKGIEIGDNTRIASGTAIYAFNHGIEPDRLIKDQPVTSRGIRIGSDVWIGANVCIRDGVAIGNGAVIGMGCVVTKDIDPGAVVVGNPARVVKRRN